MRNLHKYLLTPLLMTCVATNAIAGTLICSGDVEVLAYHQPGRLMVKLGSMNVPTFICSTDADWIIAGSISGNTTPSACKAIYATLLSAKLSDSAIQSMVFDGADVPPTCNSFVSWKNVNLRFFETH